MVRKWVGGAGSGRRDSRRNIVWEGRGSRFVALNSDEKLETNQAPRDLRIKNAINEKSNPIIIGDVCANKKEGVNVKSKGRELMQLKSSDGEQSNPCTLGPKIVESGPNSVTIKKKDNVVEGMGQGMGKWLETKKKLGLGSKEETSQQRNEPMDLSIDCSKIASSTNEGVNLDDLGVDKKNSNIQVTTSGKKGVMDKEMEDFSKDRPWDPGARKDIGPMVKDVLVSTEPNDDEMGDVVFPNEQ